MIMGKTKITEEDKENYYISPHGIKFVFFGNDPLHPDRFEPYKKCNGKFEKIKFPNINYEKYVEGGGSYFWPFDSVWLSDEFFDWLDQVSLFYIKEGYGTVTQG